MKKAIAGALLVIALAGLAMAAGAQFSPMSFGFPNIVHAATSTAWQHDAFDAFDFEDASIVPYGGYGFPAIRQTSIHTRSMSHTEFSHTSEYTSISFPGFSMSPYGF